MFERWTEGARRTIFFARYEASQYGSRYIGTEHLLLGLFRENKRLARYVLLRPGAAELIRKEIEAQIIRGERISTSVEMPLSIESKQVLQYASDSAERLGHRFVDSVHLLLGILREEGCMAAQVLKGYCVGIDVIEQKIKEHSDPDDSKISSASDLSLPYSQSIKLQVTVAKFLEAWRTRDTEKVSKLFGDDGHFWDKQGNVHSGSEVRAAIDAHFAASGSEVESAVVTDTLLLAEGAVAVTIGWPSSSKSEGQTGNPGHLIVAMREGPVGWCVASAHVVELRA
jgi:uncharacterized protein (TIGR02246 family)